MNQIVREEVEAVVKTLSRLEQEKAKRPNGAPSCIHFPGESLVELEEIVERRQQGIIDWTPTGFKGLDEALDGGLMPGQLIVGAARPGAGKSTLAQQINENIVQREESRSALFFGLEVGGAEFMRRSVSRKSGVPMRLIKRGQMNDLQSQAFANASAEIRNWPLLTAHSNVSTPEEMEVVIDWFFKHCKDTGMPAPGLITVDYLQLMSAKGSNRVEMVGAITRFLKLTARDRNIPVLALAQLNRDIEKRVVKTPVLSDLRESGSIEQDADIILFIDKPADNEQPQEIMIHGVRAANIIVAKNRDGEPGNVPMLWNLRKASFEEPCDEMVETLKNIAEANSEDKGGKSGKSKGTAGKVNKNGNADF